MMSSFGATGKGDSLCLECIPPAKAQSVCFVSVALRRWTSQLHCRSVQVLVQVNPKLTTHSLPFLTTLTPT